MSAPSPKNKSKYNSQNFRVKSAYFQDNMAKRDSKPPACVKCGRNYLGICHEGFISCFKCDQTGHFLRECPENLQGSGNRSDRVQSSPVTPTNRTAPRGANFSTGGGTSCL